MINIVDFLLSNSVCLLKKKIYNQLGFFNFFTLSNIEKFKNKAFS